MEELVFSPKREHDVSSFIACKLCLAPESEMRLSFRNLSEFYTVFKPCGLGLNILESTHYSWVCAYCWTRASQCLEFVEMVRRAEYIFHIVLQNEEITETKLKEASEGYFKRTVNLSSCVIETDPEEAELMLDDTRDTSASHEHNVDIKPVMGISDLSEVTLIVEVQTDLQPLPTNTQDTKHIITDHMSGPLTSCKEEVEEVQTKAELEKEKKKKLLLKAKTISRKDQLAAKKPKSLHKDLERWRSLQMEPFTLSEQEQREELAVRRQMEKYRALPYKCDLCAVGYHEKEFLDKHNKLHDESAGPYKCNICYGRYATRSQLSGHVRGHRRRWRCLNCSEIIRTVKTIDSHYAGCTGGAQHVCEHCPKIFKTKFRLSDHVSKVHNSAHRFECGICGRSFAHKETLKGHIRAHMREKPYACDICGKKSSTSIIHRLHMTTHQEPLEPKEQRYCVECDKYFKTKHSLTEHLATNSKHLTVRKIKCSVCSKKFFTKRTMEEHVKSVHLKTREFSCDQCDKAYSYEKLLRKHIKNKHTERKRAFVCSVCDAAFFAKITLKQHTVAVHERRRPYECDICGETFGFHGALFRHCKLKHKTTKTKEGSIKPTKIA